MLFSTPIFLFFFFPLTYLTWSLWRKAGDIVLLVASVIFYGWSQSKYLPLVTIAIVANYLFARGIAQEDSRDGKKSILIGATIFNISILFIFKYLGFSLRSINELLAHFGMSVRVVEFALPLGISFFIFHCMSYIFDVYRGHAACQRPVRFFLYILLFPQLIAGPIIRYKDIAHQFGMNRPTGLSAAEGLRRFSVGLAKKVLIANEMGRISDQLFGRSDLDTASAWAAVVCYTLQIYFDFSGYSDMAIGMMKMFGFVVPENFNYPYISQSIKEFWRRWHISLSTWFRDYLYIPLGGNRLGDGRTVFNVMLVFTVSGLWHGASWNFIVWGLWHGFFVIVESYGPKLRLLDRRPLRHLYALLVVMVGWVIFRSDDLVQAASLLHKMCFQDQTSTSPGFLRLYFSPYSASIALVAIVGATPIPGMLWQRLFDASRVKGRAYILSFKELAAILLFGLSASAMSGDFYNPFIYFNF